MMLCHFEVCQIEISYGLTPNQITSNQLMYYRLVGFLSYRSMFLTIAEIQVGLVADGVDPMAETARNIIARVIEFGSNKKKTKCGYSSPSPLRRSVCA